MEEKTAEQPLLSIVYKIPLEEYIRFHLFMGAEHLVSMTGIMASVAFLTVMLKLSQGSGKLLTMGGILLVMAVCIFLYYRLFYRKTLEKNLTKQYESTPFMTSEFKLDVFEDRMIQHMEEQQGEVYWKGLKMIKSTDELLMLILKNRRCLLIPKGQLARPELERLEELLDEIGNQYGKPRYDVIWKQMGPLRFPLKVKRKTSTQQPAQ